ncbi:MAG: hypothetical protein OHK93_007859 [Ramalina farinacea]|uniref:Uncharacterized protein n=1 Tax=Ramalina farinacea TaxID=258253 RepID=A0AA43QNG0_9LECA|nr:hypothetical protein [Ramalina farinacea]
MFSASPFPLILSLLSACLVSALTIPGPDGVLDTLEPFEPTLNHNLSVDGIDPKHYDVPGTEVWVGIQKTGGLLDQDGVLDIIDQAYEDVAAKPPGRTMNQDSVRVFTVQHQTGSYYFEVYRIFPPQPVEWEWIADALVGLRTVMTLPAAQGGIGVRSIEFLGGHGGPFMLWRGWIGVGRPPRPPIDATAQDGTVATT